MSGFRTIIANVIALLSAALLLVGVNLDDVLRAAGLDPAQLVGQIDGAVNLFFAIGAAIAGIYYRVVATRTVLGGKPLDTDLQAHWLITLLAIAIAVGLAGCAGALRLDSPDKRAVAVETGLKNAYGALEQASTQEHLSRIDCALAPPGPACRPFGHYMSAQRAQRIGDTLDGIRGATRFAQEQSAAGAPCVQGRQIEVLGLTGCVSLDTVLLYALQALERLPEE